jgi:Ras GTPase-activating-like protein IQGAP2/3
MTAQPTQDECALIQSQDVASHLEESETLDASGTALDDRRRQLYGNLFFLLQKETKYIANLTKLLDLAEIDALLQTVMFTIYGNQYDSREEYLLLSMFQVRHFTS